MHAALKYKRVFLSRAGVEPAHCICVGVREASRRLMKSQPAISDPRYTQRGLILFALQLAGTEVPARFPTIHYVS